MSDPGAAHLRPTWVSEAPISTGVVIEAATIVDTNKDVHAVVAFSFRLPGSTNRAEISLVCTPEMLVNLRNEIVRKVTLAEAQVRKVRRDSARLARKNLLLPDGTLHIVPDGPQTANGKSPTPDEPQV